MAKCFLQLAGGTAECVATGLDAGNGTGYAAGVAAAEDIGHLPCLTAETATRQVGRHRTACVVYTKAGNLPTCIYPKMLRNGLDDRFDQGPLLQMPELWNARVRWPFTDIYEQCSIDCDPKAEITHTFCKTV